MLPVRVMISENCKDYAGLLSQRLSMYPDIQIVGIAGDGDKTIKMLPLLQPDVLLLDIVMPEVDGLEVLRRMRGVHSSTAVYVISALGSDDIIRQALALGARYYFVKPFNTSSMVMRIREVNTFH